MTNDLYRRAGIEDLAEFYRTKFVSDEVLDARYFRALDRFDMRFARTMWVYDNVRAGSAVLEFAGDGPRDVGSAGVSSLATISCGAIRYARTWPVCCHGRSVCD